MIKLSICFTVYNQIDMLQEKISEILKWPEDNIEIVISDDCSTDKIKDLVDSYADKRIHYFRTPNNYGHDLNILFGINHCQYTYVMLLRTRDNINVNKIGEILKVIESNPDAGYYYTSAIGEDGKVRLTFKDRVYHTGHKSAYAHFSLPIHPSGNIYNKSKMNFSLYEKYIKQYFDNIYGFSVHQLIRCDLATKSDFVTSSVKGWVYAQTLKATDIAVNSASDKKNIYSPEYCYPRYRCEFMFIKNEVDESIRIDYLINVLKYYFHFVGYRSRAICSDVRYANHYSANIQKISTSKVVKELVRITNDMLDGLSHSEVKKIKTIQGMQVAKIYLIYNLKLVMRKLYYKIK